MSRYHARPRRTMLGLLLTVSLAANVAAAQRTCSCPAPLYPARWSVFVSTGGATFETSQINALLGGAGYFADRKSVV